MDNQLQPAGTSPEQRLTVEWVEKQIALSGEQSPSPSTASADNILDNVQNILGLYRKARPILLFAQALLFFKPSWQTIVSGLVAALDSVAGYQQP